MLRRKPTAITITNEDIIAFEEGRLRQQEQQAREQRAGHENSEKPQQYQSSSSPQPGPDPSDELKPLPGDKARIMRGREERGAGASGRRG